MKKHLYITVTMFLLLVSVNLTAQVKIGNNPTNINSASLLELESTNKGLLLPRVSDTTSISNAPLGMFIFRNADSSLYVRRTKGWNRLSIGNDNFWKLAPNSTIYTPLKVGVNFPAATIEGVFAPFQTRGMTGNTLALFGDGAEDNTQGISLVGNWPGVFFNSYFNNGDYTIAGGNTGNITLDESNTLGGAYQFKLTGYSASPNTAVSNGNAQMILNYDGKLGLNTGSVPTRAFMEQHGSIGNVCAIFGGEGTGIAIEEHYPSIGFNSYYTGSGHYSIAPGWAAEIGVDQSSGDFYIANYTNNAPIANGLFPYQTNGFYVTPLGNVGINTASPDGQFQIAMPDETTNSGLRLEDVNDVCGNHELWNINIVGVQGGYCGSLAFQTSASGGSFTLVSDIDPLGNYHQLSDKRMKKDIQYLSSDDGLQKILQLRPAKYHMINQESSSPLQVGFIAQDVEQVLPSFVMNTKTEKLLCYTKFIPLLTEAVQEQQQEIDLLKKQSQSAGTIQKENVDLKNQLATLTDTIKQLQQQVTLLAAQNKNIQNLAANH